MSIILFTFYLILFAWLINRIRFFKKSRLTPFWLTTFFLLKVSAGILYGLFHKQIPHFKISADTWVFYYNSLPQTKMLVQDPLSFLAEIFSNPEGKKMHHFFSSEDSFWNDLRHMYMVKLMAVMNLFSGSRYYINVIFYNFITFFGPIAFIILMKDIFKKKLALIAGTTFMIPSFLFWTSGLHKDGIIFTVICLVAYLFHFRILAKKYTTKHVVLLFVLLLSIFPLRNYIVLALIPGLIAWWWSARIVHYKWMPFLVVCGIGSALFFGGKYIHPKMDLPVAIVLRNAEFVKLGGNSMLPQPVLEPNFKSFLINTPSALNHILARPYLLEVKSITYFFSAIEIITLWFLLLIWFFRYEENPYRHEMILFLAMVSFMLLLLTGFIVPQLGALVRYRSIFLPFLILPIMCTIRWKNTY
jgi:hypothetical protein